jgi:hypothetical protein
MKDVQAMENRCGADTKAGGKCRKPAGWGTGHVGAGACRLHLGSTSNHELSGQVMLARREQAVMGMPLAIEPQGAILECIRIAAGEVAYASERIAALDAEDAVGAVRRQSEHEDAEGKLSSDIRFDAPAVHIWITVRRQAMDRLVSYSFAALRSGIEERRVRVAEQQGMLLAQAIQGILRELGVSDRPEVAGVVRKHLTLVSGA